MPSTPAQDREFRKALKRIGDELSAQQVHLREMISLDRPRVPTDVWRWALGRHIKALVDHARQYLDLQLASDVDGDADYTSLRTALAINTPELWRIGWMFITVGLELEDDPTGISIDVWMDAGSMEAKRQILAMPPQYPLPLRDPVDPYGTLELRAAAIAKARAGETMKALALKIPVSRKILYQWRKDRLIQTTKTPAGIETRSLIERRLTEILGTLK